MKVLLTGAGAIGGTIAVLAKEAGYDIKILATREETKNAIQNEGFRLHGAKGEHNVKIPCFASPDEIGDERFDIVIVATKYLAMVTASKAVLPFMKENGVIVGMQNGICTDEISALAGKNRTVGVMIGFGATRNSINDVTMTSLGEFYIGMADGSDNPMLYEVQKLLNTVLPTKLENNILERQYSKLIVNCCINAVAALTGKTLGVILKDDRARSLFLKIAREGMYIAKAMGIKVPKYGALLEYRLLMLGDNKPYNAICKAVVFMVGQSKYKDVKPSTLQSLERGEKTEIDIFNGWFSKKGAEVGVKVPVNDLITKMIREIEAGERKITPDNLNEFKDLI